MTFYSRSTQHAVILLAYIAKLREGELCSVRDVSLATGISEPTTAKTLQILVKEGILGSKKGPGGGFFLATSPERVSLAMIQRAVEGKVLFIDCIAGLGPCHADNVCSIHEKWQSARRTVIDFMESVTLRELALATKRLKD